MTKYKVTFNVPNYPSSIIEADYFVTEDTGYVFYIEEDDSVEAEIPLGNILLIQVLHDERDENEE